MRIVTEAAGLRLARMLKWFRAAGLHDDDSEPLTQADDALVAWDIVVALWFCSAGSVPVYSSGRRRF